MKLAAWTAGANRSAAWHADIVAQARNSLLAELASRGLSNDQVDCFEVPGAFEIPLTAPVLSCVLTPQSFHGHAEHREFFARHFVGKGQEAARACLQLLATAQQLELALAKPAA